MGWRCGERASFPGDICTLLLLSPCLSLPKSCVMLSTRRASHPTCLHLYGSTAITTISVQCPALSLLAVLARKPDRAPDH